MAARVREGCYKLARLAVNDVEEAVPACVPSGAALDGYWLGCGSVQSLTLGLTPR